MGTIICQNCDSTLGHFEDEKVNVLYAASHKCKHCHPKNEEEK